MAQPKIFPFEVNTVIKFKKYDKLHPTVPTQSLVASSERYTTYLEDPGTGKGQVHSITCHEGRRMEVWLYSFFNLGCRWTWVVNATPQPLHRWERTDTPYIEGCVGTTASLDGCGKSHPPLGIRSLDRPATSYSLNRLSYPGLHLKR